MGKRYIVLDQNVLRSTTLSSMLENPKNHFVLADLGFLEMTKHREEWELTLQKSLKIIAATPNRVHVACSIDELLRSELDTFQPTEGILHPEATVFLRGLLESFHLDVEGQTLDIFRRNCPENVARMSTEHLNDDVNKLNALNTIELVPKQTQEKLQRKQLPENEKLKEIQSGAICILIQTVLDKGISFQRAKMFLKRRPLLFRRILLDIWYCFELIDKGNFCTVNGAKYTNDAIDRHHVLTASFFHDLLTFDKRANSAHNALKSLLAMKIDPPILG